MAQSKNRSLAVVSATTPKTPRVRTYVYTKNNKSYVIGSDKLTALVSEIETNPQQSTRFYARKVGLSVTETNVVIERSKKVRKLARTGMIAILDRGAPPNWFRDMATAQKLKVPVVNTEDQYEAIATSVFPTSVNVDDKVIREDSEQIATLFGMVLARTSMTNASALAFANEVMEYVQHQAEGFSTAKRDIQALAQNIQSVNLRITNSAALRIAAE